MRNLIFLTLLIAILNSCDTVEDPIFISLPDSLKFGFNTSDTFIYISNQNSVDKFIISVTNKHMVDPTRTYDYEYTRVDFEKIVDNYSNIILNQKSNKVMLSKSTALTSKINFFSDAQHLKVFWLDSFSSPYYYSDNKIPIEVNVLGESYNSVFELYESNIDSNEVYKVQFQHQYGILRYYYNNSEVFELKEIRTGSYYN